MSAKVFYVCELSCFISVVIKYLFYINEFSYRLHFSSGKVYLCVISVLFLWRAGKIVFWKQSKEAGSHGITVDCSKSLQVSRLHFQFKSTWKLLWKKIPLGKAEKRDWKVMMKLKQACRKMSDQFPLGSKVTKHLGKMGSWQPQLRKLLEKNSKSLALDRRECRGGWKMNGRGFPFVRSCLQKLKMLKISRRSVTWGEIVQSRDNRHQTVLKKYNTRVSRSVVVIAFVIQFVHVKISPSLT